MWGVRWSLAAILIGALVYLAPDVVNGFQIAEVSPDIALKNVPFDVVFKVEYNQSDDAYDLIHATLSESGVAKPLASMNGSVFDKNGVRQVEFTLPKVVIPRQGKQRITIRTTLTSSKTSSSLTVLHNEPFWVIPGVLTLFPLIVTMTIAMSTRNVFAALLCGVFTASFLINEFSLTKSFARMLDSIIVTVLTDSHNQLIIMFAMTMGGFIHIMNESRGSFGLAHVFMRFAKSHRSTQIVALLFCFLIFFDDYASALISGTTLRPIADKMSVSREKFCFIVDAGSAADAALIPITSWTSFLAGLLKAEADKLAEKGINLKELGYEESGFVSLLRVLRYAYYSIFLIFFQLIIIFTRREFGPMFVAERRALVYGVSDAHYKLKNVIDIDEDDPTKAPPRWYNAAIPILFFASYTVAALIVLGADSVPANEKVSIDNIFANVDSITVMLYAATLASILSALLYRCQTYTPRISAQAPEVTNVDTHILGQAPMEDATADTLNSSQVPLGESTTQTLDGAVKRQPVVPLARSIEVFIEGFTDMTSTMMILVLAWSIGEAVDQLGAGRYIATSFERSLPASALPAIIFLICCAVSFATGTSWGTMALMYPICGPIAFILSNGNPELYYCSMAAILEGAVFGDHCSFISDTTIMSSSACRCPLDAHVITQMPYAFYVSFTCLLCGYLPIGMQTVPLGFTYVLGFTTMLVGILLFGARPDGNKLDALTRLLIEIRVRFFKQQRETMEEIMLMRAELLDGLSEVDINKNRAEAHVSGSEMSSPVSNDPLIRVRSFGFGQHQGNSVQRETTREEEYDEAWSSLHSSNEVFRSNSFGVELSELGGGSVTNRRVPQNKRSDRSDHVVLV